MYSQYNLYACFCFIRMLKAKTGTNKNTAYLVVFKNMQ